MATLPFDPQIDLQALLRDMENIPVNADVPFAEEFQRLIEDGKAWGPQALPGSKLATRLYFAGWSPQQIDEVGLKSKSVLNFRVKHGFTQGGPGRPTTVNVKSITRVTPRKSIPDFVKELEKTKRTLEKTIEEAQAELNVVNEALEVFNKQTTS